MTFRQKLLRWWLGANRAALQGGAVAVKAFAGAASGHALGASIGFTVAAPTLSQGVAVFVCAFIYEFANYLTANPIPDIDAVLPPIKANCPTCMADLEIAHPK